MSFQKVLRNIWIVFLFSGLWHGASWAFVIWGALHAAYLTLGALKNRLCGIRKDCGIVSRIMSVAVVNIGVAFAWIFFRAGTIDRAIGFLKALFRCKFETSLMALCAGLGPVQFGFCIIAASIFVTSVFCPHDCGFKGLRAKYLFTLACVAAIIFIGMPSGGEFIYFRF